ncbi:MAG: Pleckstrin homology domain containing protein [Candidatus Methanohalarchaeum thermophilum]|uniref:Pleckstrin homology domain containing protein n=1 Tax=Methanohalarchaeum thermophilum TaxID=1903181 RepID=A0A1Q6DV92_METT1|nr:MAG: Pleckstrin homology domain containing protein [Candidatus Methanohalarchaeum thermophilum]
MSEDLPDCVTENLGGDEEVVHLLEKRLRMEAKPKRIAITDRRILYVDQKLMGRYDLKSVPYQKLEKVEFDSGLVASEFKITTESGEEVELSWLGKSKSKEAIETIKNALNKIAVEPIGIDKRKKLKSERWILRKPKESISKVARKEESVGSSNQGTSSSNESKSTVDRLKELKELRDEGIISEEEYEEKRQKLVDEL